ncbi:MAG: trypsin-like peptidase domain-containing protein, partial [Myxococcales bacterium]|nr:trypsin-like peptidase domain-containing protein [Myxococcales bacterium]
MRASLPTRAVALLGAAAFGAAVAVAAPAVLPALAVPESAVPQRGESIAADAQRPDLGVEERKTIDIFRRASPAVVNITRLGRGGGAVGTGSGFVWDRSGHVVTNFHVVQGAAGARVTLRHKTYDATIVGVAVDKDLAVLRIQAPASELSPLILGSSDDLLVGQHVFAIGNPFGLDQTLSTGVISGLGREIKSVAGHPITGVVQTDAA